MNDDCIITYRGETKDTGPSSLGTRLVVILLAGAAHGAIWALCSSTAVQHPLPAELSVTLQVAPATTTVAAKVIPPGAAPRHTKHAELSARAPLSARARSRVHEAPQRSNTLAQPAASVAQTSAINGPVAQDSHSAPETHETEPDYSAAYLDNQIIYPKSARRMGQQGRVLLLVEVLASGNCGSVELLQGSGFNSLDQAALESVKNWRFVPARHNGQAYTRRFRIPIQFTLKDS